MRAIWTLALALVVGLLPGCNYKKLKKAEEEGDKQVPKTITFNPGAGAQPAVLKATPAVDRIAAANDLKNIWNLAMIDPSVPPPASLEQFNDLRTGPPRLFHAVKEGHYVVCWNANRGDGNAIFAYWKGVPEQGGPVVLVSGEVIPNMQPDQFAKTPKAGKTN